MNKIGTETIETKRLILRRFTAADAEDMFKNWASDPEVTKYLTWPTHTNADVTHALLNDWASKYEDGGYFNWAIEYKENAEVIGNISVVHLNENIDAAEIGYCIGRAYWGREIMPEALTAVIDYLFEKAGMNRVAALHDANNAKSGRVIEKAGMKYEGTLRSAGKNNQGICDMVVRSIIRSEWG